MKRTKLFSLALLAAAWLAGGSARAWDEPAQDAGGVYQIGTASELEWYAEYINAATTETADRLSSQAVLTADIDMTGVDHSPIGASTGFKFAGKFDGQFHTISNLVINRPDDEALGLFGVVRGNAKIMNIIMDASCSITGKNRVGSIIGLIQTNTGNYNTAPLDGLDILNCVSYATLTTTSGAAGMIGAGADQYPYFDMENCVNAGTVSAVNKGSAFCGWNKSAGGNAKMWNCLNIAEISVLDGGSQLFRGLNRSIANCYDTFHSASNFQGEHPTYTTADPLHSGEICYLLNTAIRSDLASQVNPNAHPFTQDLSDPNSIPLPIPGKTVYKVADYYCDGTAKGTITYSNTDGGSIDAHVFDTATGLCTRCSYPNENWMSASEDGYYHLSTVAQVEWFSNMVSKAFHGAMNAKLDNDIDFGGVPNAHKPIGTSGHKFGGKFDGQGHRIKGMVITQDIVLENRAYDGVGFFGSVRGGIADQGGWSVTNTDAVIENLIIDSSCSIDFDNRWAAGILGHINSMETGGTITVRNCGNEANINGQGDNCAGIVGISEQTALTLNIIGCWNTGNITSTGAGIGGIFGGNNGSKSTVIIKNCWNEGNVVGNRESSAISAWMGSNSGNDVTGCYNIGQVTGLDGNRSLYRGTVATGNNLFDVQTQAQEGKAQVITTDMIPTGELCYLLNGDQSDIQWTQTLDGTQPKPLPDASGSQVYCHGQVYCSGESAPGTIYNNEGPDGVIKQPHVPAGNGFCSVCNNNLVESLTQDEEGFYLISNAGELEKFSDMVETGGQSNANKAKLTADIDMAGVTHKPIGGGANDSNKFNSTFDGQNHTISNLTAFTRTENVGLFSWVRGSSTIKNLIIDETCSFTGTDHVAAFVGKIQAGDAVRFENCINKASVTCSNNHAAAFVGKSFTNNLKTNMINCGNEGRIESGLNACALVSWNTGGTIKNCWNVGEIVKSDWDRANGADYDNTVIVSTLNLFNGNSATNVTLVNTFDASPSAERSQGTLLDASAAASGELAYKVGGVWRQTIGTDAAPVLAETSAPVSYVGEAGWATMYDETTGYELNGDVEANVAVFDGNYLQLTKIENVPASTPVILKGSYYNKVAADLPAINVANELKGTAVDTDADGTMYVLAKVGDKVGFYKANGTIAAGKAYYQSASLAKAFFFDGEDDPTGIDAIGNGQWTMDNVIYNLAGQRVGKMRKGINIVNGKKVLR